MNRPLKEHYEVDSDSGIMVRTFDYIAELEKYCNFIESERLRGVETKNATVQILEKNFTEYMKSFESHRDELNEKIALLESKIDSLTKAEKEAWNRALEAIALWTTSHDGPGRLGRDQEKRLIEELKKLRK